MSADFDLASACVELPADDTVDLAQLAALIGGHRHYALTLNTLECMVLSGKLESLDNPQYRVASFGGRVYKKEREQRADLRVTRKAVAAWAAVQGIKLPADNACARWLKEGS